MTNFFNSTRKLIKLPSGNESIAKLLGELIVKGGTHREWRAKAGQLSAASKYFEVDDDGYPLESSLKVISSWPVKKTQDCLDILEFIQPYFDEHGLWEEHEGTLFELATGGWSGCEDVIDALKKNPLFWLLSWYQSQRGGSYMFHVGGQQGKQGQDAVNVEGTDCQPKSVEHLPAGVPPVRYNFYSSEVGFWPKERTELAIPSSSRLFPPNYYLDLTNRWEEWREFVEWYTEAALQGRPQQQITVAGDVVWPPTNVVLLGRASTGKEFWAQADALDDMKDAGWRTAIKLTPVKEICPVPDWGFYVEQIIVEPPEVHIECDQAGSDEYVQPFIDSIISQVRELRGECPECINGERTLLTGSYTGQGPLANCPYCKNHPGLGPGNPKLFVEGTQYQEVAR